MRETRRATAIVALVALVAVAAFPARARETPEPVVVTPAAIRTALDRSHAWLAAHPPDPARTAFGFVCLDAWTWVLFATWHPDAGRRAEAGEHADRVLRALRPPSEWTPVALSYWALALAMMDLRGLPLDAARASFRAVEVEAVLAGSDPTTRWWTAMLLRQAGVAASADAATTFLGTHVHATPGEPTTGEAYAVFHEIVPASGLGQRPLKGLGSEQVALAIRVLPRLLEITRAAGDTDAAAETVATLALLGQRDTPAYRDGLAWLLERQNEDGTYRSARDARREATVDGYRHVVLVTSFAVLTAVERFEPVVPRR